ncbi:MAG: ROK family protein [Leptospiraceae bacterium]|nr:ROK family protein [Leptospiraceae bacterium]MCP5510821.1 ROK family protein [Leptospiraceae bacterium]
MNEQNLRIGIDLGGTKIEIIALEKGSTEVYRKRVLTPQGEYLATVEAICNLVNECESVLQKTCTVGVGIPGSLSSLNGLVRNANSVCLIGEPLQKDLENRLEREVRISNDANCMTVSEATDGAAEDGNLVFGVILGTGTGGGISFHKKVWEGVNRIAGEWGHNPMPDSCEDAEVPCYCGKVNCIETFLSGPGFVKRYQILGGREESPIEILNRARSKDPISRKALDQYCINLAKALSGVINILDPDTIVLAGGMSNIEEIYSEVPRIWKKYIFSDQVSTRLVRARHGDSSGVRGAAWLW